MNKQQASNFDMFSVVELHFNKNPTAWNSSVPIAHAKEVLSTNIATIRAVLSIQLINNTGVALDKKTIRERLETQAYALSSAARAYATFTNTTDLLLRVNYTPTFYVRLRDAELQSVCINLITTVEPFVTALEPYKVTPDTVATLTETINLFAAYINKPQESIETKKEATTRMALLIKSTADLLKTQLDPLMVGLKATEPNFVMLYTTLRRIKSRGQTKLSLTTLVVDATTLLPIEGAALKILKTNIKRVSTSKGKNIMKNVVEGRHKLMVSHKDYLPVEVEFVVIKGLTTKLEIALEAVD